MSYSSFRVPPSQSLSNPPPNISPSISSTSTPPTGVSPPTTLISQPTYPTPLVFSLPQLCTDVKTVLQRVETSNDEQKKMSKNLNELVTKVKLLEGVICGSVGRGGRKAKISELDTVKSEGGIVRRLAAMDDTISELLEHVSTLDTARRNPVVCYDASTNARMPSPPVQKEYFDVSTATDDHLPAIVPPSSSACLFRPLFPSTPYSPDALAPADWNANPVNSHRPLAFAHSQEYMRSVQRGPSLSASTESSTTPSYTMLPEVFNTAPSSPVTDVSSRLMTPLHTDVPANGPDRFCSSPLPTPSPDTPHDESFSMASDSNELNIRPASKLWSWAGSRRGLDGPDRTSSTTSFSATSHSSFHPTLPLSAGLVHNPARASMPPAFKSPNYASSSEYNPAPSHLPSASTLHSTSSTSLPFNHTILRPASNFVPIPPTPPSSSLSSSSAHSDIMHLASPPPTPVFALTRERVAVLRHEDIRGMDCEGPCVDCDTQREHGGHEEYRDKCMDSQEQSPDEETQDHIQSTSDDSSRMCFDMDTSSGEMGSPSRSFEANAEASPHILEAQPEGSGVEPAFEAQDESTTADSSPMCLDADTSSGEVGSPPPSFEADAEASASVLDAQLGESGLGPEVPLSAFEAQDGSTIADSSQMCFDTNTSSGDMGPPSPSFEAGAETSAPVHEARPERSGAEPELPMLAFEAQVESTIDDSSHMCFDTDTSSGDIGSPSRSFEDPSSPVPEAQLGESGVISLRAFEARGESMIGDSSRISFDTDASSSPPPSFEEPSLPGVEPELSLPALEPRAPPEDLNALRRLIHGCELPLWPGLGVARMREGGEPRGEGSTWTHGSGDVNADSRGSSPEVGVRLDHTPDAGVSGEVELDRLHEPGREHSGELELEGGGLDGALEGSGKRVTEEGLQIELEGGGLDGALEESVEPAEERSDPSLTPDDTLKPNDTRDGCSQEHHQEHLSNPEDSVQPEPEPILSEPRQPTPSNLPYINADHLDQCEPLHAGDSREPSPADSLFRDEEAVATALAAISPSTESESGSPPPLVSPEDVSVCLPLQSELEASCPGIQDQGDGPTSQESREILDDGHGFLAYRSTFTELADYMNGYTDGETSALRSTCTEDLAESDPAEIHVEQEHAVTTDHQEHVESDIHTFATLSVQPEDTRPGHSPLTVTTLPPAISPSSLSYRFNSLSPLSSLGESPPTLERETKAGDGEGEGRNKTGVELRRTDSLDSNEDFGFYKTRSVLVHQKKKRMLRSTDPHESSALSPRGGPRASIEELSVLARKDLRKVDSKRKFDSSESAIQSPSPGKRTRLHGDVNATSFSMDHATPSFSHLAHRLQRRSVGDPMRRSSCSSASAENVTTLQVESVSAPMDVDDAGASASASGTGTISEPAQTFVTTSEIKSAEKPANEPGMDSIAPEKRVRPLSWKAKQINTQKAQKPERIGKPNSRRPQKRKSKSLATQDEAQMCQWPARPEQEGSFQWQFVQCDNCDLWYHFGCVGIGEGDPRLEPESVFICPPCCVSSAKRQTMRKRDGTCARSDCSHTQLEPEEFIIERLVGRKTIGAAGYLFLVKWEGYAIAQASWIPEGSIIGASKIFDRFVADATAEGIGLNAKGVILLEEARDGGWSA